MGERYPTTQDAKPEASQWDSAPQSVETCVAREEVAITQSPGLERMSAVGFNTGGLAGWQVRTSRQLAAAQLAHLTVSDLAAATGLSPQHFSRAFRKTFGVPPCEWLVQQRLAHAKARLLETSDTVDEIALSLGYKSGSQLSRAFRRRFGLSPQAFRRA